MGLIQTQKLEELADLLEVPMPVLPEDCADVVRGAIADIESLRRVVNRMEESLLQIVRGRNEFEGPSLDYMQGYRDGQEHQARIARKALGHGDKMVKPLVERLRELCDDCLRAPQNRHSNAPVGLEPMCSSCQLRWEAADELEYQRDIVEELQHDIEAARHGL